LRLKLLYPKYRTTILVEPQRASSEMTRPGALVVRNVVDMARVAWVETSG